MQIDPRAAASARLERGEAIRPGTIDLIRAALEGAGVEFIREWRGRKGSPKKGVAMKIKGLVTHNNAGGGIHVAGGAVSMEDVHSYDNGGAGIRVEYNSKSSLKNIVLHGNRDGGLSVEIVEKVRSQIPILKDVEDAEIVDALKAIAESPPGEQVQALRNSMLGRWLEKQKAVDWGRLATDLFGLLAKG